MCKGFIYLWRSGVHRLIGTYGPLPSDGLEDGHEEYIWTSAKWLALKRTYEPLPSDGPKSTYGPLPSNGLEGDIWTSAKWWSWKGHLNLGQVMALHRTYVSLPNDGSEEDMDLCQVIALKRTYESLPRNGLAKDIMNLSGSQIARVSIPTTASSACLSSPLSSIHILQPDSHSCFACPFSCTFETMHMVNRLEEDI